MTDTDTLGSFLSLWIASKVSDYFCWLSTFELPWCPKSVAHKNRRQVSEYLYDQYWYHRPIAVAMNSFQNFTLFLLIQHFWVGIGPKSVVCKNGRVWSKTVVDTDTWGLLLLLEIASKVLKCFCWLSTFELASGQNLSHTKTLGPGVPIWLTLIL